MNSETSDFDITDWKRIMFGEAPAEFLFEVLIRGLCIYCVLLIVLNIMGKRMTGQLALADFAIMITMGGIVSVPMQVPESGILLGIVVLLCALSFHQGFNIISRKFPKFEDATHGKVVLLVKDGIMQLESMKSNKITHQQLFSALRTEGVYNLGSVRRVYLEPYGPFTTYRFEESKPGLCILPVEDLGDAELIKTDQKGREVCSSCGAISEFRLQDRVCEICGGNNFVEAIV